MITLEDVIESYKDWQDMHQIAERRRLNGQPSTTWAEEAERFHRYYLSNVRQYDLLHPAIQVGKDIGA
jgi:hypothetical protein